MARNSVGMPKLDLARSLGPRLNLALEGFESAKAGRSNISALLFPLLWLRINTCNRSEVSGTYKLMISHRGGKRHLFHKPIWKISRVVSFPSFLIQCPDNQRVLSVPSCRDSQTESFATLVAMCQAMCAISRCSHQAWPGLKNLPSSSRICSG